MPPAETAGSDASALDASALLALLYEEEGAEVVVDAIAEGVTVGAINWAEALSKVADRGDDPRAVGRRLVVGAGAGATIWIEAPSAEDCLAIAELRPRTRRLGLSLADRACLALALRLGVPVVTADRVWAEADVGVEVRLIR